MDISAVVVMAFATFIYWITLVTSQCYSEQQMVVGQIYYVSSPNYPNYYEPSTNCIWYAWSPAGSQIQLNCRDVVIPASHGCKVDVLAISSSGDTSFSDAETLCGTGTIDTTINSNRIAIGLFSSDNSPGGRFGCSLKAVTNNPTPTPPPPNPPGCCGWKQPKRIVGGNETGANEYPAMAAILTDEVDGLLCGSTIISTRYLITAAHCIYNRKAAELEILVGDHDLTKIKETPYSTKYAVQGFKVHEYFNAATQENDIAIIQTRTNIQFSLYVGPICLPFAYQGYDFNGQTVTALGWGAQGFSDPISNVLQQVDLTVIDTNTCISILSDDKVSYLQICTYGYGKDTCNHDSGGPLLWTDPATRKLTIVGIISYGIGCATSKPSVNTRITQYLSWIQSNTPGAQYCT